MAPICQALGKPFVQRQFIVSAIRFLGAISPPRSRRQGAIRATITTGETKTQRGEGSGPFLGKALLLFVVDVVVVRCCFVVVLLMFVVVVVAVVVRCCSNFFESRYKYVQIRIPFDGVNTNYFQQRRMVICW